MESKFDQNFNVNLLADKSNLKHLYPILDERSPNATFYKKDKQANENVADIMYQMVKDEKKGMANTNQNMFIDEHSN